jgi:hypothetical protein
MPPDSALNLPWKDGAFTHSVTIVSEISLVFEEVRDAMVIITQSSEKHRIQRRDVCN